jgi:spermidine synthase
LIIEILAARILAPYVGVSLEVFTGIIGVILAGISVGAWLGGRAADQRNPRQLLGPLLVAGGLSAIASPLIVDAVGPNLATGPVSIVLAATLGFFAPAAALSAVPPIVVKIRLASLDSTGSVVGSYSAVGTAGAILGTFVTGFFLIAAFPTRPIVAVLGASLTVLGLGLWVTGRPSPIVPVLLALLGLGGLLFVLQGPCDYETTYHCAIVEVDESRTGGRTLVLDRMRNSYVDLDDPEHLEFRYMRLIADIVDTESPEGPLRVVSIGGGGFTMPGYLNATRPGTSNIVLEIDGPLVEIGFRELALTDETEVIIGDARMSLQELPEDLADVVIGDAFSGASVPWHLTTVEFSRQIRRVLTHDGVYAMNVIDYGSREFVRSSAATLEEVFNHVALFAPRSFIDDPSGGNYVLAASGSPIDVAEIERKIRSRDGVEQGVSGSLLADFIDGAKLLTDDFAPVDQMVGGFTSWK